MYKNQRRYKSKTRETYASVPNRNRQFGRGQRKTAKKLDINLFIKKASGMRNDAYISSKVFSDLPVVDKLKRNIGERGYINLTQIQEQAIPYLLDGRDVIGISNTGTGKTAAFLIPLINKAYRDRNQRVLIVTPTRELAMQIVDELKVFTRGMDLEAVLLIGGANMQRQEKKLWHNPHFIIGTPGRIRDFIERKKLSLHLYNNVVLDEVDRMVDIGFIKDITYFISLLPRQRQSLFFSATVSEKVKSILNSFVVDPVTITVKKQETAENVDQDIVRVNGSGSKIDKLHNLLTNEGFDKVLIFGRTKYGIEKLTVTLLRRGFKAAAIHGNKTQGQRQRALEEFKMNKIQILLATDVASRGLDIDNVTHVINYDAPETYDDYIHRIGRTGRAGRTGTALTFVE